VKNSEIPDGDNQFDLTLKKPGKYKWFLIVGGTVSACIGLYYIKEFFLNQTQVIKKGFAKDIDENMKKILFKLSSLEKNLMKKNLIEAVKVGKAVKKEMKD